MTTNTFSQYNEISLNELVGIINRHYFVAELLCKQIKRQAEHSGSILLEDIHMSFAELTGIFNEVQDYATYRKEVFIPYIKRLIEKTENGAMTNDIDGWADIKLSDFSQSPVKAKDIFNKVTEIFKVRYDISEEKQKFLRKIRLLDDILNEIYYIEDVFLLPKIELIRKGE